MAPLIVLDTSVLIAGFRSRGGASHQLLRRLGGPDFRITLSVPLVLEHEAAAKREARTLGLTIADVDEVIDYLCSVGEHRQIFYLWRPVLRDPLDDMVLELAVEAAAEAIVTHNMRDFVGAEQFGIRVEVPGAFLRRLKEER